MKRICFLLLFSATFWLQLDAAGTLEEGPHRAEAIQHHYDTGDSPGRVAAGAAHRGVLPSRPSLREAPS